MEAPSTIEVPCPACGEPIILSIGFDVELPTPGASHVSVLVRPINLEDEARSHGEVCSVLTGGGRDE